MKNVFIIGSKGIPANYGGYETFVEFLTLRKKDVNIKYHVACLAKNDEEFEYNGARCFNVATPNIGPAKAVYFDIKAIKSVLKFVKERQITDAVLLILACRIGIVFKRYVKKLHKLGIRVIVNPDGHEWKRSKWPWIIKKYWKYSEKRMIKYADDIVCDSVNIEKYIQEEYKKYNPKTCYISYGSDVPSLNSNSDVFDKWASKFSIKRNEYYLVVGRFVPENNYELVIREFMKSSSKKKLVIVTNTEKEPFYDKLQKKTNFASDERIMFVGTIYDHELLSLVRINAFAYIHGHSVGGTNPSLLEGLSTTNLSLLFDVPFNREVGQDACLYFNSDDGNFVSTIYQAESLTKEDIERFGQKAKNIIKERYSWDFICSKYEEKFYG